MLFFLCASARGEPSIELPPQDYLTSAYPVNMTDISYPYVQWDITTRYNDRPLRILLPYERGPHPIVVFNHGRPFQMPVDRALEVNRSVLEAVMKQGWALALPVRSGYYLDQQRDGEYIACNSPGYDEFVEAGASAGDDLNAVVDYLTELEFIDGSQVILAGTSAGGFASVAALKQVDSKVMGVISINGGRCGRQGNNTGGLHHLARYYESIARTTVSPVYFLSGSKDDTIPEVSTVQLFDAFKRNRSLPNVKHFSRPSGTHRVATMIQPFERALSRLAKQANR